MIDSPLLQRIRSNSLNQNGLECIIELIVLFCLVDRRFSIEERATLNQWLRHANWRSVDSIDVCIHNTIRKIGLVINRGNTAIEEKLKNIVKALEKHDLLLVAKQCAGELLYADGIVHRNEIKLLRQFQQITGLDPIEGARSAVLT